MRGSPHADPGKGVFETMLVLDGQPVELEAHLARLSSSLAALFGSELPGGTREAIADRARPVSHGKLRLTVAPGSGGRMEIEVATTEVSRGHVFPPPRQGVALRSFVVEGGLGAHKWADRDLLERIAASAGRDEVPLLVDADGSALEASRGNVFSAGDGWIATPPADGRILPGIARGQALEVARQQGLEAREEQLTLDDLRLGEIFLAGSVRGVEPVRRLDGVELEPSGEVSGRIADGLRRRWLRVPQGEAAVVVAGGRRAGRRAR
jgi:para-aminobenzoate synthetase / 4-amino-4-deoxychorismate lyase